MTNIWKSSTADFYTAAAPLAAQSFSHHGGFGFEKPGEGNTDDWLSPSLLVKCLGPFDLDPCGCAGMPYRHATTTYFLPEHDGLAEQWDGRVYSNPPYGRNVAPWAEGTESHAGQSSRRISREELG
jgi:hypothetical protein